MWRKLKKGKNKTVEKKVYEVDEWVDETMEKMSLVMQM